MYTDHGRAGAQRTGLAASVRGRERPAHLVHEPHIGMRRQPHDLHAPGGQAVKYFVAFLSGIELIVMTPIGRALDQADCLLRIGIPSARPARKTAT